MDFIQTIVHSFVNGFGQNFPAFFAFVDDGGDVYPFVLHLSAMRTFWLICAVF